MRKQVKALIADIDGELEGVRKALADPDISVNDAAVNRIAQHVLGALRTDLVLRVLKQPADKLADAMAEERDIWEVKLRQLKQTVGDDEAIGKYSLELVETIRKKLEEVTDNGS